MKAHILPWLTSTVSILAQSFGSNIPILCLVWSVTDVFLQCMHYYLRSCGMCRCSILTMSGYCVDNMQREEAHIARSALNTTATGTRRRGRPKTIWLDRLRWVTCTTSSSQNSPINSGHCQSSFDLLSSALSWRWRLPSSAPHFILPCQQVFPPGLPSSSPRLQEWRGAGASMTVIPRWPLTEIKGGLSWWKMLTSLLEVEDRHG